MSDHALRKARTCFGYAVVTAALVAIATWIGGLGGEVFVGLLLVALGAAIGWWWFDHCLEVRRLAESFRAGRPRADRDIDG